MVLFTGIKQNRYHDFMDFQNPLKEYGTQPYGPPCRKYNITANLVHTIEQLHDKANSAVRMNESTGE